jgi:hypothetical protein
MIPQGGGDFATGHCCAGEWLTIAVMKSMISTLLLNIEYELPKQDLSVVLTGTARERRHYQGQKCVIGTAASCQRARPDCH